MLLTVYDTEWPILRWCAVKKILTHSLIQLKPDGIGCDSHDDNEAGNILSIVSFRDVDWLWMTLESKKLSELT